MDHYEAVALAASALAAAIAAARKAGYRVDFPDHVLTGITVSETARVVAPAATIEEPPVPTLGRASKPAS